MNTGSRSDVGEHRHATVRAAPCDAARRRQFLKIAVGLGVVAISESGGLAAALWGQGQKPPASTCTTTFTYTWSTSSTQSFPSAPSYSYSGTETALCDGTLTSSGSRTGPESWSFSGNFQGVEYGVSTYSGGYTQIWGEPGTSTSSQSCAGGVRSFSYSHPSQPSWSSAYSNTESGTYQDECSGGQVFNPPTEQSAANAPNLPPTLDERRVLHFPARILEERQRRLRVLGRLHPL